MNRLPKNDYKIRTEILGAESYMCAHEATQVFKPDSEYVLAALSLGLPTLIFSMLSVLFFLGAVQNPLIPSLVLGNA